MRIAKLKEAAKDLRYLLNRGYNKGSSLDLVVDRYQLEKKERWILLRGVYSRQKAVQRKNKLVEISEVDRIGVDGYNVLITVETCLRGGILIKSDDGLIRDVRGVFGKYKIHEKTREVLNKILMKLEGKKAIFYYDSQVSRSGELAGITRELMEERGVEGEVKLSGRTDYELKKFKNLASSDGLIIDEAEKVVDIPSYFVQEESLLSLK